MLQTAPRARHGLTRCERRLVIERLARRRELGLGLLQLLVHRLRHANVLLLVTLQLTLQPLLLPLRFALDRLALLLGLAPRCFVLAFRRARRRFVLPQRGLVLTQRRLVLPNGLLVLLLGFAVRLLVLPLRLAHGVLLLLHRLAMRLFVLAHRLLVLPDGLLVLLLRLALRLAHRLLVLLDRLAVCLLVLAHPQLVALAPAWLLDVLALARRLRFGQQLAQLLHLAFGLRELGLGRFDARRGAFDQFEGVLWDGLGSGDDGGEGHTQGTADKGAGEHR
ncbi:MAG TPA: hypothetical protein VF384_13750 [Planctomycetota bacterium]